MADEERVWTIEELADVVGVPVRTIRYYIAEGLLPGPGTRGKGTVYSDEHRQRLRLIRLLADRRVPLAQIREQVAELPLDEVNGLLAEEQRTARAVQQAAGASSPKDYVSSLLAQARGEEPGALRQVAKAPPAASDPERATFASPAPLAPPPVAQEESSWQRFEIVPGVELHVRSDVRERHGGLVRRLLEAARTLAGQRR